MEKEFKKGQLVAYCPTDLRGKIYKVEIGVFSKYTKDKKVLLSGITWVEHVHVHHCDIYIQ